MPQPSAETIEILRNIETEIGAGKAFRLDHDAQIWNAAHDRALEIIQSYRRGCGLFQMTADMKARGEQKPDA
jgi:hypothetical protein